MYWMRVTNGSRPGSCPESENGFAALDGFAKRGADVKGRIKKPKLDKDMAKLKEPGHINGKNGGNQSICLLGNLRHETYETYAYICHICHICHNGIGNW